MRTLCLIIARGGSKDLPNKNLLNLRGKPLIAWPIIYALNSEGITDVVVSTDSHEIAETAQNYGAKVPFIRPPELAGDLATTESVLTHGLMYMEEQTGSEYDYCIFLTATDIFRPAGLIEKGLKILEQNKNLHSYFVGQKTTKNYWEMDVDGNWFRVRDWMADYGSRQNRKFIVREDTGLACISRATFWRQGRRLGDKVYIEVLNDSFTSIDIHTSEDLELANSALGIRFMKSGDL
jgi:CMP-N-acetylneuraminic acid synthetase